jgi:hypothetical protein
VPKSRYGGTTADAWREQDLQHEHDFSAAGTQHKERQLAAAEARPQRDTLP